jgi:hypothetical protein
VSLDGPRSSHKAGWWLPGRSTPLTPRQSVATDPIGEKNATLTAVTLNGSGSTTHLNNAGVFNGTSSTGITTLAGPSTATFTISFWLSQTAFTGGRSIANSHTDADNNGFQFLGAGGFQVGDFGNGSSKTTVNFGAPTTSAWHMFTITYDGVNLLGYVDGVAGSPTAFTGPMTNGVANLAFGFNPAYSGDFWAGMMAGVAIWNRALTSGEVASIAAL